MTDLAVLEDELNQPLEQMLTEARGEVWRPVLRVCRNGHKIRSEWDDVEHGGYRECRMCAKIKASRR